MLSILKMGIWNYRNQKAFHKVFRKDSFRLFENMSFWFQMFSDPALFSWDYLQKKSTQPLKSESFRAHFLSKHFSISAQKNAPHPFKGKIWWVNSVSFLNILKCLFYFCSRIHWFSCKYTYFAWLWYKGEN